MSFTGMGRIKVGGQSQYICSKNNRLTECCCVTNAPGPEKGTGKGKGG